MAKITEERKTECLNRNRTEQCLAELLEAAQTILQSLEWEEHRSGTTYNGYETLREAINKVHEIGGNIEKR